MRRIRCGRWLTSWNGWTGSFNDGQVDAAEAAELKWVMEALCGVEGTEPGEEEVVAAFSLPIDQPQPKVLFTGKEFVVTGNFAAAKRGTVMEWIEAQGGVVRDGMPSSATDYLVIGAIPSKGWKHGAYGRKIEAGMEMKESGAKLAVISEDHFIRAIKAVPEH